MVPPDRAQRVDWSPKQKHFVCLAPSALQEKTRHKNRFHSLFICDSHIPRINGYAALNLRPQVPWPQRLSAGLRPPDSDPNFWNFIEEKL